MNENKPKTPIDLPSAKPTTYWTYLLTGILLFIMDVTIVPESPFFFAYLNFITGFVDFGHCNFLRLCAGSECTQFEINILGGLIPIVLAACVLGGLSLHLPPPLREALPARIVVSY